MIAALPVITLVVAAVPAEQRAIEAAMADSAAGWNAGDLDRFLAVYAEDAVYVAGEKVARGKAEIRARYAPSFVKGGNSRGRLSFATLSFRMLGGGHAVFVGRWTLTPASGAVQSGMTSLVFARRGAGWRIVADHSS